MRKNKRVASNEFQLIFLGETSALLGKIACKENELDLVFINRKSYAMLKNRFSSNAFLSIQVFIALAFEFDTKHSHLKLCK